MRTSAPASTTDRAALVYLIHLEQPYKHARHYLGWTVNLPRRLAQHRAGTGSRLLRAVTRCGIRWEVVRLWRGGPALEQQLKTLKNNPRLCPVCIQQALLRRLKIGMGEGQAAALWAPSTCRLTEAGVPHQTRPTGAMRTQVMHSQATRQRQEPEEYLWRSR